MELFGKAAFFAFSFPCYFPGNGNNTLGTLNKRPAPSWSFPSVAGCVVFDPEAARL